MKSTKFPTPPRLAAWLVKNLDRYQITHAIIDDMQEVFTRIYKEHGPFLACFWYWGQCLDAVIKTTLFNLRWRLIMFKNYLKIALRNIQKHKEYSFINIAGLAIGMACFILMFLYVQFEFSFDKHHKNADNIYRVIQERPSDTSLGINSFATTPPALAPALMEEFPEVVASTRIGYLSKILVNDNEKGFLEEKIYCVEPETFDIFTIPFVKGVPQTALNDPFSIILSERMAAKYFRNENPVGKVLTFREKFDFKVTGVIKTMPINSHFVMDFIIPFADYFQFKFGTAAITEWSNYSSFYTYLLMREGADKEELEQKLPAFLDKHKYQIYPTEDNLKDKYSLQPLTSIHLHSSAKIEISASNNNIVYIYLFSSCAFLLLLIGCFNYMNMTTANSVQRGKEVGMRKVVGAGKGQLVRQFLSESIITTILALLTSFIIVRLALPAFNNLVGRQLVLNPLENLQLSLVVLSVVLFVGFFSGSYPAFFISSLNPAVIVKGSFIKSSQGTSLRNVLVITQFAIAIILIIGTLVVKKQFNFIKYKDMGYDKEQIVVLHTGDIGTRNNFHNNIETIKAELKKNPEIISATGSKRLPHDITLGTVNILPGKNTDANIPIYGVWGDEDFVDVYGMEIIEGRNFSKDFPSDAEGAILINEMAAKASRWESPIGQSLTYWGNRTGTIVGILKDFHFHSLHKPIEPLCIYFEPLYFDYLSMKISASNIPSSIEYIEKTMKKFSPKYPFEYHFFDEIFDSAYRTEQKTGQIFSAFTLLSLCIACMGLFGLAMFTAQQRIKEIGIRKILGASAGTILLLLLKEFTKWVLIANVIAWPIAYMTMNRWLQNFIYRINIDIWTYIFAAALALVIAFLTVSYHSLKAATANPIDSLRYE